MVVYEKNKSWEIKSVMRFSQHNSITDTLLLSDKKLYQMYLFSEGSQHHFGEVMMSQKSAITVSFDSKKPFISRRYSGDFSEVNNFLSNLKFEQKKLSTTVQNGIQNEALHAQISQARARIEKKAAMLHKQDFMVDYGLKQFDGFSEVLILKNKKYLYKSQLTGTLGADFTLQNNAGQPINLKSFHGKYVYIDVWATWCKPCKLEYPHLKALAKQFSKKEIAIVSVSIDESFEKWQNDVKDSPADEHQFYAGAEHPFVTYFDIGAIPRFILLNQEGKIINPEDMRPSNPKIIDYLKSTINRKNKPE